jgi:hypothetical protein
MTEQEELFLKSIQYKIEHYDIHNYKTKKKLTVRDCLPYARNKFVKAHYNDDSPDEIIDIGIESFLYKCSPLLFLEKYAQFELPGVGKLGCKNLYYFQKEILKDFNNWKKIVATKTRQCLTEDNYVYTDRGYISIKNVKIGDKIQTIKDGKLYYTEVLNFINQGKKQVCKIITVSGDIIKCTLDHKVLTKDGWKEAKDLTIKDELVSNHQLGNFGNFKLDDDKLAALIGYYLADGKGDSPVFVNTNIDYINECKEAGELFENCYPTIRHRSMNGKVKLQGYDLVFTSKSKNPKLKRPFLEFKKRFGLNKKSVDRIFTEELMNLNKHQMSILINRLFAGDGWVTYKKDSRRPNTIIYEIGIGAPNYCFLKQLEYILKTKYGICCKVQKQNEYVNGFWKLRIQKKSEVKKFIEEIGVFNKDQKIIEVLKEDKNFYNHYSSNSKIKKIEILDGEENVYDITTETHDFLANNLVVHNCGMSTLTSLIFFWKAVLFPNEWLVVISKDGKSAQDFLDKIKTNLENIPEWFGLKITKNNVKGVAFSNKTKIDAFSRSKSAGRGTSPTMVILDEAAFYLTNSIIEGIVSSVMPSLSRTGGQLFVVSTPNGSAEGSEGYWYYNQVRQLQEAGGTEGLARLYDVAWWEVLDYPGITPYKGYNDKVQTYIDRDYFNHPEVKKEAYAFFDPIAKNDWKNNEWLSYQMSTAGKVKYMQEILQNFVVTGNTVFSDEIISKVNNETKVPLTKDMLEDRPLKGLWIWKKPLIDHKYILSCDVAKGSSDDSSCLQVLDMSTYEQVAEYSGKCTTIDLANYAYKLGEYYNWAFEVIECNSIGEATFSELYYNLNYPNLFKQKKVKQGVEVMTGWITSTKSRDLITDKFIDFYYDDVMWKNYHPFSERLLDQMKYWIWKGGRPDHAGNAHDDNIMAMAIGLFNISEGIKRIRGEDDTFFIDENGNNITMKDNSNTKLTDEFLSTKKEGEKVNDYVYRSMERKMYQQAGINPADEDAAETLKWLMS